MYCQIMHIIGIRYENFNVKVALNIILTLSISNPLATYFYDIKVFQFF
jgi:hypothetical protein